MKNITCKLRFVIAVGVFALVSGMAAQPALNAAPRSMTWQAKLKSELPRYGHRNWIVIADSAYPSQSAEGIETIYTRAGQLDVVDAVLKQLKAAPHVFPVVLLDEELASVPDKHAPGIEAYRKKLKQKLKGKQVEVMPHEEIIGELAKASKLFNVLILKTDMALPYTSVFLRLECGYWDAGKEKALREALKAKKKQE
jgi:hypothetical protein